MASKEGGSYFDLTDIVIFVVGNIPVILFALLFLGIYYLYTKILNPAVTFIDDNFFEPIVNTVNKLIDGVKKEFGKEISAIKDFSATAVKEIDKIKSDIVNPISTVFEAVGKIEGEVESGFKKVFTLGGAL